MIYRTVARTLNNMTLKSMLMLPTIYATYSTIEIVESTMFVYLETPFIKDVKVAYNMAALRNVYTAISYHFKQSQIRKDISNLGYEMDMIWRHLSR